MSFNGPALPAREILETPTRGIKSLINGDTGITVESRDLCLFMERLLFEVSQASVQRGFMVHHDRRATGGRDVDAYVEVAPAVAMPVWQLDEDAAPDNACVELFQPAHTLANV